MKLNIRTTKKEEFIDITDKIKIDIEEGFCQIYCPHTTAGLTINEGADPSVRQDIISALDNIVPNMDFKHREGNSLAHIKASLMGNSVIIPVKDGKLMLGIWQSIFFCEFDGPRQRQVFAKTI